MSKRGRKRGRQKKARRRPPVLGVWWKYRYALDGKGQFFVPTAAQFQKPKLVSLTAFPRLHVALARVRTEKQARQFVARYGLPRLPSGDGLRPGYSIGDLLLDAARLRFAARLAGLLKGSSRMDDGTLHGKLLSVLGDPEFEQAFADNQDARRARRHFLAERGTGKPHYSEDAPPAVVLVSDWQSGPMRGRFPRVGPQGRPMAEVLGLLQELMRQSLAGRLPLLMARWEPLPDALGHVVWEIPSLLDWCWLQFLRSVGAARVPKVCPCGEVHDRRGIYHSEACRNRFKAKRHYARARRSQQNRATVSAERESDISPLFCASVT